MIVKNIPKITITIPSYNQALFIRQTIESALAISYSNLQVVLSDDNSTDRTFEIAKEYEKDSRFKAFQNKKNIGRVANYKKLLYELANGDWILNCDGDDYLLDTQFFEKAMKIAETDPEIIMFSANRLRFNEETKQKQLQTTKGPEGTFNGTNFFYNYYTYENGLFHLTTLYKRAEALAADFYRKNIISADIESLLRIIYGKKICHINETIAVWREHEFNASRNKDVFQKVQNLSVADSVAEYYLTKYPNDSKIKTWKKSFLKKRIMRIANKYLLNLNYFSAIDFLIHSYKKYPRIVIETVFNIRFLLTFFFPFRKRLIKFIRHNIKNDSSKRIA